MSFNSSMYGLDGPNKPVFQGCATKGCTNKHWARGYCKACHEKISRSKQPNNRSDFTDAEKSQIRQMFRNFKTKKEIAEQFNTSARVIQYIVRGK